MYICMYIYTRILKSSIPSTYHSILLRIRGTLQPCDERRRCCPCRNGNRPGKNGGKNNDPNSDNTISQGKNMFWCEIQRFARFFLQFKKNRKVVNPEINRKYVYIYMKIASKPSWKHVSFFGGLRNVDIFIGTLEFEISDKINHIDIDNFHHFSKFT